MPSFGENQQGPGNFYFPKGENAAWGVHQIRIIGSGIPGLRSPAFMAFQSGASTGLVQPTGVGSGGVPGVTATLTGTGVYSLRFPPTKSVDINARVYSSSGYAFQAQVNNLSGPSGSAQLEINRVFNQGTGVLTAPSGQGFLPTGSVIALDIFGAPANDGVILF
jgi:hypothetical protein